MANDPQLGSRTQIKNALKDLQRLTILRGRSTEIMRSGGSQILQALFCRLAKIAPAQGQNNTPLVHHVNHQAATEPATDVEIPVFRVDDLITSDSAPLPFVIRNRPIAEWLLAPRIRGIRRFRHPDKLLAL